MIWPYLYQKGARLTEKRHRNHSQKVENNKCHKRNTFPRKFNGKWCFVFMLIFFLSFSLLVGCYLWTFFYTSNNVCMNHTSIWYHSNTLYGSTKKAREKDKKKQQLTLLLHSFVKCYCNRIVCVRAYICIKISIYQIDCQKISHWMSTSHHFRWNECRRGNVNFVQSTNSTRHNGTIFKYSFWYWEWTRKMSICCSRLNVWTEVMYTKKYLHLHIYMAEHCVWCTTFNACRKKENLFDNFNVWIELMSC